MCTLHQATLQRPAHCLINPQGAGSKALPSPYESKYNILGRTRASTGIEAHSLRPQGLDDIVRSRALIIRVR